MHDFVRKPRTREGPTGKPRVPGRALPREAAGRGVAERSQQLRKESRPEMSQRARSEEKETEGGGNVQRAGYGLDLYGTSQRTRAETP